MKLLVNCRQSSGKRPQSQISGSPHPIPRPLLWRGTTAYSSILHQRCTTSISMAWKTGYVLQHYTSMRIVSGNNIKTSKVNPSNTITFPKYKKGGYIVRKLMEDCTYGYMDCLFEELIGVVNLEQEPVVSSPNSPNLCSSFIRPEKAAAVAQHKTTFS